MPVPRRFTTEAVVIRHLDYGEADRILTLYSPDQGKIHAIAKGVRRSRSRNAGHLDLFSRCSVLIAQGRNFGIVEQAQIVEHFPNLRGELSALGQAHYVCELVDSFVPDSLPSSSLYALHVSTLRSLKDETTSLALRAFELGLLDHAGYRPELHNCVTCGTEIAPGANHFGTGVGGVLCPGCGSEDPAAVLISTAALKLMRNLQTNPGPVLRLESVDIRLAHEIRARLHEYISYRLERRPKSIRVLERLESAAVSHS